MLTYYKSVSDTGGAKGDIISNGELNALFPTVTLSDKLNGATYTRKMWIKNNSDATLFYGLSSQGEFTARCFVSDNDDDTVSDLTGNERKLSPTSVVSNTQNSITITDELQIDDHFLLGRELGKVTAITDNGDDTWTITPSITLSGGDYTGQWLAPVFMREVSADTPIPLWIEVEVAAGSTVDTDNYFNVVVAQ